MSKPAASPIGLRSGSPPRGRRGVRPPRGRSAPTGAAGQRRDGDAMGGSGGSAKNSWRPTAAYQPIGPHAIASDYAARVNDDLVRRMLEASELHGDFVLSSGRDSTVYFDKFRFLTSPTCCATSRTRSPRSSHPGPRARRARGGGDAPGGGRLARDRAARRGRPQAGEGVRHARAGRGRVADGAPTTLLEDVSTTGHQVQRAAEVLEAAGADVGGSCWRSTGAAPTPPRGGLRRRGRRGASAGGLSQTRTQRQICRRQSHRLPRRWRLSKPSFIMRRRPRTCPRCRGAGTRARSPAPCCRRTSGAPRR